MSNKTFLVTILTLCFLQVFSQTKTSSTNEGDNQLLSLNSITKSVIKVSKTKSVDQSKKRSVVGVVISTRRRVLRKRNTDKDIPNKNHTRKANKLKNTSSVAKKLHLKKNLKSSSSIKASNIKKAAKNIPVKEAFTFNEIEVIPQFESCNEAGNTSLKCYNTSLIEHIQENFVYPEEALDNDIQGVVYVSYIINQNGKIVNIATKGPKNGEALEAAAKVLIKKLPKLKPGSIKGKPVNVKYSFPVTFALD